MKYSFDSALSVSVYLNMKLRNCINFQSVVVKFTDNLLMWG